MRSALSFTILLLLFAYQASAQGAPEKWPPEKWPIDKIVALAMEHSPEQRALAKDIDRAEALARQAGRWDNPITELAYGPMTLDRFDGVALDVSLRQSIPLFGQKAIAARIGEQNKVTVESESLQRSLVLRHEVMSLAYRLGAINEEAQHIAHRRESIRSIARFLETRPHASPSQAVDKSLIMNRLREIEEDLLEITAGRERLWLALNVFLDLKTPIVPEIEWPGVPNLPDRDEIWKQLQAKNPLLRRQESLVAAAALQEESAGKKAYPDIRLGAFYNEQTAVLPQKIYSGIIELSLPIFDRGGAAKVAAQAQKEAETSRLEQARRDVKARFEQSWATLLQNSKRVELYPVSLLSNLERQLSQAEQNWRKGLLHSIALLELEHQTHAQAVKYYAVRVDFLETLGQLRVLAGVAGTKNEGAR